MSADGISTTKENVEAAFIYASNGAIKKGDIDSISLSQNEARTGGRRAPAIDVVITLNDAVNQSTANNAAAESVEFEVVVGGVATEVMQFLKQQRWLKLS